MKLLFLVLNRSEKEWKMPPREWAMAKARSERSRHGAPVRGLKQLRTADVAPFHE
jgi:hypothetical protein